MDIRLGPLWLAISRDDVAAWGICLGQPAELRRPLLNIFLGRWECCLMADGAWRQMERLREWRYRQAWQAADRMEAYYQTARAYFEATLADTAARDDVARASAGVGPLWRRDGATEGDS